MELVDAIRTRKSIRKFRGDVKPPDLSDAIALAKQAPSAGGIRGFRVYLTDEKVGPYDAPLYAVICSDKGAYEHRYGARGTDLYALQDATIFGAYLQLILVDMGLSSCWIGAFNEGRVQRDIGTDLRPVAILAIGYAV